jgi:hypothetical protein
MKLFESKLKESYKVAGNKLYKGLADEKKFLSIIKDEFGVDAVRKFGGGDIVDYADPKTKEKLGQLDKTGKHTYIMFKK